MVDGVASQAAAAVVCLHVLNGSVGESTTPPLTHVSPLLL